MDHVKSVTSAPNFCVTIMQELWPVTTSAAAFLTFFLNASKHIHSFLEPSLPHYLPIFFANDKKMHCKCRQMCSTAFNSIFVGYACLQLQQTAFT